MNRSIDDGIDSGTGLRRSLSLPLLTLYGPGNILGARIYVLIGKVGALAVSALV